ncbi:MAG: ABC transporter permease [Candidatus Didemnitutus sp.]|nr:ABC transporter permease [Candidatus Didemnitutus sp.]
MSTLLHDLRFAVRLFAKSPGFTAVAVATLAVAIGVNSAIFSLVNGLLLKSVVLERPQEVVSVFSARKDASRDYRQFSFTEYQSLLEAKDVFTQVAAVNFSLAGIGREPGEMHRSFVFMVTDGFFPLMGAKPAAGRFFNAEETRPNSNVPVVVASYALWQRMGGRADFVGSTLRVNDRPYTVIGIAPEGFSGISALIAPEVWLPTGVFSQIASAFGDGADVRDLAALKNYTLNVYARLAPGLTLESAKARLPVLEQRLTALQPPDAQGTREIQLTVPSKFSISTSPESDGSLTLLATLLIAMAGAVLLIASLNLANMLLARGTARAREMAVRLAIGASRGQIVRQLLVEGLLLSLLGGGLGLLLSYWSNTLLENSFTALLSSMNFTLAGGLKPDATVLTVTTLFCLLSTLVFSLGPALKAARTDVVTDLKSTGAEATGTGRFNRFFAPRHILVMVQMTLSLVLLFSAGLFFRGALNASGLDKGFDPANAVLAEMDFSLSGTLQQEGLRRMSDLADRVRALPGVESAGYTTLIPYGNITNTTRIMPASEAMPVTTDPKAPRPGAGGVEAGITPGFLRSIGVRILRGRDFTETEARDKNSPKVVIVDEGMAAKLFPNGDALGQRVKFTQPPTDGSVNELEIVGICSAHRHDLQDNSGNAAARRVYFPLAQRYNASVFLVTRFAARDPQAVLATLPSFRAELRRIDAALPLLQLVPYTSFLERSITLWIVRLGAVLFGIFGGVALALAVVGVYGVKAYAVERRTREIGIRMALGAEQRDVFALIMKQGALQTVVSVAAGAVLSLLVGQVLASALFKVSPMDPLALGLSAALLSAATLAACFIPARRATRVSPTIALRAE